MRRTPTRTLASRSGNAAKRATVEKTNEDPLMREVDLKLHHDEAAADIEHFEPYGFTSRVHPPNQQGGKKRKAEAIVLNLGDNASHGVVIVIADRRYRLKGLKNGEVAIFDDQGQKVHITRDGVVIKTPKKVDVTADDDVTVTTKKKATITADGDITATTKAKALVKAATRAAIGIDNLFVSIFNNKVHLGVIDPDTPATNRVVTEAGPSNKVYAEI